MVDAFRQSWPADALKAVATKFLDDVDIEPKLKESCVNMCMTFHTTTQEMSDVFLHELGRYNYVTPTSYLEQINTFKELLRLKRKYSLISFLEFSSYYF